MPSFKIPPRITTSPDTAFETSYSARSSECDAEGFMRFPDICNYLQETAADHAVALDVAKGCLGLPDKRSWALTRLRVELTRYPRWRDEVIVLTFPRGMRKLFAYRDFLLTLPDGETIGRASSEWMVIDLETRRATRIPEEIASIANTARQPLLGEYPFAKFEFPADVPAGDSIKKTFAAQRSHVDINGHVNNVRYFEWMLEAAPEKAQRPLSFEAVFRAEVTVGEQIVAESAHDATHTVFRISTPDAESVIARVKL